MTQTIRLSGSKPLKRDRARSENPMLGLDVCRRELLKNLFTRSSNSHLPGNAISNSGFSG
eukprot:6471691-Amphidinium_carterae.4